MEKIKIEEKYVLEYIKDSINDNMKISKNKDKTRLHHNRNYNEATSIIQNGILSLEELNKRDICKFTTEQLKKLSDSDSHINGIDNVSLSVAGLTDLYDNEEEYFTYDPNLVDFNINDSVKAYRNSINYGNEYIHKGIILRNQIDAIDIRILELINNKKDNIDDLIKKYNYLKQIAASLKETKLDRPFREMSKESFDIDIDNISANPILIKK